MSIWFGCLGCLGYHDGGDRVMGDGNLGRLVGVSAFYGWRLDDLKDDCKTGCMKIQQP